jgi:hypothetical protein
MKTEVRIVGAFTIAGLILPFGAFFLWRLATREDPLLTMTTFNWMADILWPARHFYIAYSGPWNWIAVGSRFAKAEAINALIYGAFGAVVGLVVRLVRTYRWQASTIPRESPAISTHTRSRP